MLEELWLLRLDIIRVAAFIVLVEWFVGQLASKFALSIIREPN